ncbi:Alternative oxidase 1a, mitochondrial [Hordeum vulgare]|nr:Alternative oxidase 1a, mitochondrial [Hordeum vulgare]
MKKKKADGSGSSKPSRKRLAGRVTVVAAPKALASSLVEPPANTQKFNIAQNLFKGEEKKTKKGNIKKGRPFTFPHCYEELKDDEKWKKRDGIDDVDESNKRKKTIELDHGQEETSSDDGKRSPIPNSVSYSKPKRPDGCKKDAKEKKKRKGDDELKNAMESIVKARKEANEVRKMARTQDAAAEERRLTAEERRVAAEERKVTLEERKVAMKELSRHGSTSGCHGRHLFGVPTPSHDLTNTREEEEEESASDDESEEDEDEDEDEDEA